MREREIENVLVGEMRRLGGKAYKWTSPGNAGVPDRIVIFPGRPPVFVELKTDLGEVTALQTAQITRLRELGQEVEVVKGIRGLVEFFESRGHLDTAFRIAKKYDLRAEVAG